MTLTIEEFAARFVRPQMEALREKLGPEKVARLERMADEWAAFERGEGPLPPLRDDEVQR